MRALYICYFGINENLVQTQVLPYLKELARHGHEMHLVTFEPRYSSSWTREAISNLRQQLESKGISWTPLAYHKSPTLPATLFDICAGLLFIWRLNRQRPLDILHARSHIPMIMALLARYLTGSAVIFDIRGLIADEYVDAGVWQPASPVYRGMKYFEALGIRRADRLIVLTKRMKDFIIDHYHRPEGQISVIPCCIDPQRFIAQTVGASALSTFEIVYAGSVTGLYLLEEMGRFFLAVLDLVPKATLRILTSTPPEEATAKLCRLGIDPSRFNIQSVSPD
ncbi:MAG: glycosyltransferase, partial [Acidobacteriota bacterium]